MKNFVLNERPISRVDARVQLRVGIQHIYRRCAINSSAQAPCHTQCRPAGKSCPRLLILRRNRGFTLLELIATLALAVIVMGLGVPSMISMVRSAALVAISNEVVVDFQFARSEAMKLNIPVTVCAANASSNGCISGTDWTGGWIVFGESVAVNGAVDTGETIFRTHTGAGEDSMEITMTAATNLTNALVFLGNGFPAAPSGLPPSGTLQICYDGDSEFSRNIVINKTGRIETTGEATSCI